VRAGERGVVLGLHRSGGHDRDLLAAALSCGVTGLDTAYNYRRFGSHRWLAVQAGDLLGEFTVSTKVGFFPGDADNGVVHSLDPARVRRAVEDSAADLGIRPAVVFLHNPERTLAGLPPAQARDLLVTACSVLASAATEGLCAAWGIASWDPRPLLAALADSAVDAVPRPEALMVRTGLLVRSAVLDAAERLADLLGLSIDARWGMSPFGGDTTDPIWEAVDPRLFLTDGGRECGRIPAALRLAYELPPVSRIAAGTSDIAHLRELRAATVLDVDGDRIARYRALLRDRASQIQDRDQKPLSIVD
jgi:pyridoxine 4-dehydrogenase